MTDNPDQLKALRTQIVLNEQRRKLKQGFFVDGALAKISGVVIKGDNEQKKKGEGEEDDLIPDSESEEEEEDDDEDDDSEEEEENENQAEANGEVKTPNILSNLFQGGTELRPDGIMASEQKSPREDTKKFDDNADNHSMQKLLDSPKIQENNLPKKLEAHQEA